MMNIPDTYNLDHDVLRQDLPKRGAGRLLGQFRKAVVLNAILEAFGKEIQELSDAIVDVMKFRSLPHAPGVNLDALGRIVGQPRTDVVMSTKTLLMEDGSEFLLENEETVILADIQTPTTDLIDDDYRPLVLLRSRRNFSVDASVPELTKLIYDMTGVIAVFIRTGMMSVDIELPSDTDPVIVEYIRRRLSSSKTDDAYLFPFPATLDFRLVFRKQIWTEAGAPIMIGDKPLLTERTEFPFP